MNLRDKLERLQLPGRARVSPASTLRVDGELAVEGEGGVDTRVELQRSPELERLSAIRGLRERLEAMRMKPLRDAPGSHAAPVDDSSPARPRAPFDAHSPRGPSRWVRQGVCAGDPLGGAAGPPSIEPARAAPARVAQVASTLPGERSETPLGALTRVVTTHSEDHRHGNAQVALARHACAREVALLALDPTLADVDFSRALYLDTETTGLSGGTGTLPFLIGMAWFDEGRLVVEQLLLPRPGLEAPMLARLAERIGQASVIVSYNGKSFDWPLLRTRFILNRIAAPGLPPHLDLLHCARRVFKARLGSVRLVYMEQELMGFERVDDIHGALIPETYLSFLRGATPGSTLLPIIDHNRSDLVALPALLGEIARRFAGQHERQDARDQFGFAKVAARGAAAERAIELAHAAVTSDARGELAASALFFVGELKLRQGDLPGALHAFEGSLEASLTALERARAHLALAKLHEHKTKQCARALLHASETAAIEGESASERRVARLAKRQRNTANS